MRGEQVGFTHFWTVEHHFLDEFSHCSAPEVLYGAIAARTSRIKIGHGVRLLPAPYNHPLRVAEMAATLDCLSRRAARVRHRPVVDPRRARGLRHRSATTRASMWEEALDVVVGAWTERGLRARGTHFQVPPRRVHPKPLQKPHPPLWVASTNPDSHAMAGRSGLGLLSFTIGVPPEELAARIQLYRDGLAEAKPIGKFVNPRAATFTMVHCAETNEEAQRNAAESVVWYLQQEHGADRHAGHLAGGAPARARHLCVRADRCATSTCRTSRSTCSTRWAP